MFKTKNAAPGVRVVSVKTDSFKTNVIEISMALPLDEHSAANAILIKLLKRTSKDYPDFTLLNQKLDGLYGASLGAGVSKFGDAQILTMAVTCLDDRFALDGESISEQCIELLADMIFRPNMKNGSFGAKNLALEKRLMINSLLEELDDKRSYARTKCLESMCASEPYGRHECGTIEEVKAVKMSDVREAWKNLLTKAVFQITVVGGTDIDSVCDIFEKRFSKIDRQPCKIKTVFKKQAKKTKRVEELQPIKQGKLVIGYRTGMKNADDNYYAFKVMTDIFGGGTYSKLFANVREKMSLAYYCSSRLISSKGIVIVQSGIDTSKEQVVTQAVTDQLNDVASGNFDDEILASSKRSLTESFTFSSPEGTAAFYSVQIFDKKIQTPEEIIAGINAVTKEQVCEAASKLTADTIFILGSDGNEEESNED